MEVALFIIIVGGLCILCNNYGIRYNRDKAAHVNKDNIYKPAAKVVYTTEPTEQMLEYDPGGYKALTFRYSKSGTKSKVPEWFIDVWVQQLSISPAEAKIIDELQKYRLEWHREVTFKDMPKTAKGAHYRLDFLLPTYSVVIEYHGKLWHQDPEKVKGDKLKAKFCAKHNIEYIILDSSHYYHLAYEIETIMERLGVTMI